MFRLKSIVRLEFLCWVSAWGTWEHLSNDSGNQCLTARGQNWASFPLRPWDTDLHLMCQLGCPWPFLFWSPLGWMLLHRKILRVWAARSPALSQAFCRAPSLLVRVVGADSGMSWAQTCSPLPLITVTLNKVSEVRVGVGEVAWKISLSLIFKNIEFGTLKGVGGEVGRWWCCVNDFWN